ncbi:UNVERIFIED_CONTAM: Pentatricopeptide repeat-containing protein, mitochondrial [Sesamum radiatum]|uniref:Pentatricopeptide repeat-containing protein, mitochondrial n=1 Tax=Sesamum radiatum TaxID=300843 RepID=A0AAW2L2V4_SESRA
MLVLKSSKFYKRLYSCSSVADSEASYLTKHIDSFLSNSVQDSRTLLSTHSYIITTGHAHNRFIAAKLIASYASFNQPHSSTKVFHSLSLKDPFLWNSIIKAHFSNGNYVQAVEFFSKMPFCFGNLPNQFTIPMVVSACAELGSLCFGMNVHGLASKLNLFCGNSAVGASFVYMYSKCGVVDDASLVFDEIAMKDVVAWTAIVIGYVQNGESDSGLQCLCEMHRLGGYDERPNFRTLEGGFQACGNLSALTEGRCLHGFGLKSGIVSSHIVQSAVLSMYSKCGSIEDARVSFCEVVNKDLFSWTSFIGVHAKLGYVCECFQIFLKMQANGVYPDGMVSSCLISGFANSMKILEGKAFHGFILRRNFDVDQIVYSSLMAMYCKFGLLALAEKIFFGGHNQEKDCWNLMVVGYEKAGLEINCIKLYREMQHEGIEADLNSVISVISSCSRLGAIHFGRSMHCHIIKSLMFEKVSVVNSLINMYGKCGNLAMAQSLFHQTTPDIATWNSLISCYAGSGHPFKALTLFDKMISTGLKPNTATLVTLLSACAQIASVDKGRKIHDYIREHGFEYEVSLTTALVDMYAKCGQIDLAKEIFDSMNEKDVVSWNVMISSYGMHGHGKSAINIFQQMEESGSRPNDLTFLAVLSACAHAGLVDEGKSLFGKMKEYSIIPTLKHYACMVDLFGRSGCLHEAESLVLAMPFAPDGGIWGSLLTACKMHNNAEMGIKIAKRAIETDPENDGYYILISDFYSSVEMWKEVEQVRRTMKDRGVRKTMGWSTV